MGVASWAPSMFLWPNRGFGALRGSEGVGSGPITMFSDRIADVALFAPPPKDPAPIEKDRNPMSIYRIAYLELPASLPDSRSMGWVSSGVCLGRRGRGDEHAPPFRPRGEERKSETDGW